MASDLFAQIRQKLDEIIAEAKNIAKQENDLYLKQVNSELLSPEKQIIEFSRKKESVTTAINSLENKEYYRLAKHEHLISIVYFSRTICLGKDDKKPVMEGVVLYEKEQCIDRLLQIAKKKLKPLTYPDYLAGHENVCLYQLDERPPGTSDEDYESIRAWQVNKKISCIKLEFGKFRENFNKEVKEEAFSKEIIQGEIKLLEIIFSHAATWKSSQLVSALQQLKGMAGISMEVEKEDFHHLFVLFLKGNNLNYKLSPAYFEHAMHAVETSGISGMPVFGFSLAMYCRWLHHIALFKKDIFDREEGSLSDLFSHTFDEGSQTKELILNGYKKKYSDRSYKDRHYESLLLQGLETQRKIFNNLDYPHYFTLLEETETLKYCFIDDCLRSLNIELPKEELRQCIILNENVLFLSEELCLLKHDPLTPSADQLTEIALMIEILCHMAPETELINLFLDAIQLIKKQVLNEKIPLYFICENSNGLFNEIIEKAFVNFKKVVGNLNVEDKGRFISDLLRDINYMETINGLKCRKKNQFFRQFKHILKNELKSAYDLQNFNKAASLVKNSEKATSETKPISFGYRTGPRALRPIVVAMNLEFDLFGESTTADDFMEVLMCKDLSKNKKMIQLAAKYNILEGLRKRLLPWCPNLKPALMEQSGIFMSLKEGPLKAMSLYKATSLLLEVEDRMDAIFKAKYR